MNTMSFRNNGRKRDPKYLISSIFMLIVGIICLFFSAATTFKSSWTLPVGVIITFLGILMFKNANEQ